MRTTIVALRVERSFTATVTLTVPTPERLAVRVRTPYSLPPACGAEGACAPPTPCALALLDTTPEQITIAIRADIAAPRAYPMTLPSADPHPVLAIARPLAAQPGCPQAHASAQVLTPPQELDVPCPRIENARWRLRAPPGRSR